VNAYLRCDARSGRLSALRNAGLRRHRAA